MVRCRAPAQAIDDTDTAAAARWLALPGRPPTRRPCHLCCAWTRRSGWGPAGQRWRRTRPGRGLCRRCRTRGWTAGGGGGELGAGSRGRRGVRVTKGGATDGRGRRAWYGAFWAHGGCWRHAVGSQPLPLWPGVIATVMFARIIGLLPAGSYESRALLAPWRACIPILSCSRRAEGLPTNSDSDTCGIVPWWAALQNAHVLF